VVVIVVLIVLSAAAYSWLKNLSGKPGNVANFTDVREMSQNCQGKNLTVCRL